MFAHQGTPFFITAFVSLLIAGYGLYLERMKKESASTLIFNATAMSHFYRFLLMIGTCSCEIIIAVSILMSEVTSMHKFANILLVSRLVVQAYPIIFFICDKTTLRPMIDSIHLFKESGSYRPLIFLCFFECSMITFLPWKKSNISEMTNGFPTVILFRLCLGLKTMQLVLTFIGQVGCLVETGFTGNTFSIFVLSNIVLSSIELSSAIVSATLQCGLIAGLKRPSLAGQNDSRKEIQDTEMSTKQEKI
jgi:hypothetical protein